ncbi:hypothetical protein V865_001134 [Kwoniella europaea PYCC6329]|uniref:Spindle pole body-associated protein cut12 domain-containing protein n=1 Tax=Kwoniella europaea PYCC6329 TaxID=1423913 RepID=A0AAX4KAY3_9TREE
MPVISTQGTRRRFYNDLARDVRKLDTLALPVTFHTPSHSRGGSQWLPQSSAGGIDDGWDSIPTSNRGGTPRPLKHNCHHVGVSSQSDQRDGEGMEQEKEKEKARASIEFQPSSANRHSNNTQSGEKNGEEHDPTRTPPSNQKVKRWINDVPPSSTVKTSGSETETTTPIGEDHPSARDQSDHTHTRTPLPYPKFISVDTKKKRKDKMNYLHEDMPSTSYRRYPAGATGTGTGGTYHYPINPTRIRSPPGGNLHLHHTNPFSSGNFSQPSTRTGGDEDTYRMSHSNLDLTPDTTTKLERTLQAKKREFEDVQRRLEESKKERETQRQSFPLPPRPPTAFTYHRSAEHDQIIQLRQENTSLHSSLSEARRTINALNNRIDELELSPRSDPELIAKMENDLSKLSQQNSSLNDLCRALEGTLGDERDKNRKMELETQSSKKGQSACAKSLLASEQKVKELENTLKEVEERERIEREKRDLIEKRYRGLELNYSHLTTELETWKAKTNNAYREKEGAISKYKGKENDNAKLSDKLNLSRREKEALQARLDEVIEEKAQLSQRQVSEKGNLEDRKKLKEELHRERSTSDRLRSERNTLRDQIKKIKLQLATLHETKSQSAVVNDCDVKLHHPTPNSSERHKPKFPSSFSASTSGDMQEAIPKKKVVVEVIEDEEGDGVRYEPQRVNMEDLDEENEYQDTREEGKNESTVKSTQSTTSPKNSYAQDIQSILSPQPLTFHSIPLVPQKLDTPISKEEQLLFANSNHSEKTKPTEGKGINGSDDAVASRKKWLEQYAEMNVSTTSPQIVNDQKTETDTALEPNKKPKDPFADLDPLDHSSDSIKLQFQSPRSQPSASTIRERSKTLNESLIDLLTSSKSTL